MSYKLVQNGGDATAVPQIVFTRLAQAEPVFIQVALFVLSHADISPAGVARGLHIDKADAQRALDYWAGAGLLEAAHRTHAIDDAPAARPARRITTAEVTQAAVTDPAIAFLVQECQRLWGRVITQADTNIMVGLYLNDGLPVDLILMAAAHYGKQKSARYVESVVRRLQAEGIDSGEAMEQHIAAEVQAQQHALRVAEMLNVPAESFTKGERTLIAGWYSGFGYQDDMILEALGYAGDKKTVRYINGILRAWYGKGIRTVRDVMASHAAAMQNVQVTGGQTAQPDLMQNDLNKDLTFRKRGAANRG